MALVNKTFSDIITFTRASTGTFFNSAGVLTSAAIATPRFDYDPSTLAARGLLIEESRTNSASNNTMVGAVAGTPGTPPSPWGTLSSAANGITRTIVGTSTENGITYIEVQYTTGGGTTSASGTISILPVATTAVAAASGQTWTGSTYIKLQAGSFANLTNIAINVAGRDSGGVLLENTALSIAPTNAPLSTQRYVVSRTLNNASTAFVTTTSFNAGYAAGVSINFTLRIGLPQLENNNISTGVSTATVQAGGTGYTNGDTLTVVGGTGTAATLTVTGVSAGVITTVSVATAGSYSVFPTSPVSVTGGTGTLATFNLTPVSQTGFATSVIQTSGATATRNSDIAAINTLSPWYNATEGAIYFEGLQFSVAKNSSHALFSDGTASNFLGMRANPSSLIFPRGQSQVSGSAQAILTPTGTITANTTFKEAFAYKASDFAMSYNGGALGTAAAGTLPTVTRFEIGNLTGVTPLNGYISRITYYPRRLSNAELQAITA